MDPKSYSQVEPQQTLSLRLMQYNLFALNTTGKKSSFVNFAFLCWYWDLNPRPSESPSCQSITFLSGKFIYQFPPFGSQYSSGN